MTAARASHAFLRCAAALLAAVHAWAGSADCYEIRVVDGATGRGVPLVELTTTFAERYYTDSAGRIAICDTTLFGQEIYFKIRADGYQHPADGFGSRGVALTPEAGGQTRVAIQRVNIAERLYRITGLGVYHHTRRLGLPVPLQIPSIRATITGQDSVQTAEYRGRLYWFWGDTGRLGHPLGYFQSTGATTPLPYGSGFDPSVGIPLDYRVDDVGRPRPMCPLPEPGAVWLGGVFTCPDEAGAERLVAHYSRVKGLGETLARGLAVFDNEAAHFRPTASVPLDATRTPGGGATYVSTTDHPFVLFTSPWPGVRVRRHWPTAGDPQQYEAFTCLAKGSSTVAAQAQVERDKKGQPLWRWTTTAPAIDPKLLKELIEADKLAASATPWALRDVATGGHVHPHSGTIRYNAHRKRWVMIFSQIGGDSFLGETWFAEADTPLGPWVFARKIVSHAQYTFYNVYQHRGFDRDDGRRIFFEGTYSQLFSGVETPTPRYDYNQIMYSLDVSDVRLMMPVAVYRLADGRLATRTQFPADTETLCGNDIAFFALPPSAKLPATTPLADDARGERVVCRLLPAADDGLDHAARRLFGDLGGRSDLVTIVRDSSAEEGIRVRRSAARDHDQVVGRAWANPIGDYAGPLPFTWAPAVRALKPEGAPDAPD